MDFNERRAKVQEAVTALSNAANQADLAVQAAEQADEQVVAARAAAVCSQVSYAQEAVPEANARIDAEEKAAAVVETDEPTE